ncbi:MAG: hypothetical protein ACOC9O_02460 [Myxococcota bacterium]
MRNAKHYLLLAVLVITTSFAYVACSDEEEGPGVEDAGTDDSSVPDAAADAPMSGI